MVFLYIAQKQFLNYQKNFIPYEIHSIKAILEDLFNLWGWIGLHRTNLPVDGLMDVNCQSYCFSSSTFKCLPMWTGKNAIYVFDNSLPSIYFVTFFDDFIFMANKQLLLRNHPIRTLYSVRLKNNTEIGILCLRDEHIHGILIRKEDPTSQQLSYLCPTNSCLKPFPKRLVVLKVNEKNRGYSRVQLIFMV